MKDINRCNWCLKDDLYINYHDLEWGKEIHDDNLLFEYIVLEGTMAGLSWHTILKKRENYRTLFFNFDPKIVANFTNEYVNELLNNKAIIRHRGKIEAAIQNAKCVLKIKEEYGSLDNYLWGFIPNKKPIINFPENINQINTKSEISEKMSKDMKNRGFKFVAPTTIYSFMQAVGMVNDHLNSCQFKK